MPNGLKVKKHAIASRAAGSDGRGRTDYWFFMHVLARQPETVGQQTPPSQPESEDEKRRRLEAVLFLAPEGISSRKLAKLAGLADATEARTLIRQLNGIYDRDGRPYRVEEVAGGYALLTRSNFAPWLRRLSYIPGETRLGQSAIETLSVVAYRQPVLRANIEAIRGVGCSEVLKHLMELDLVRISGRSEDLGRPYLYGTTRRFLQMFGLRSADRLPRIDWVNNFDSNEENVDETSTLSSQQQLSGTDSEAKESTVRMSFTGTAVLDGRDVPSAEEALIEEPGIPLSAVDDDDDFDADDDDFEDDDADDDESWDDDDDDDVDDVEDDVDDDLDDEEDLDDDEDDLDDAEDGEWEEVDDDGDDDWDDEDEDEDDDWDEDDEDEDDDWD